MAVTGHTLTLEEFLALPEEKPALEAGGSIDAAERRINPAAGRASPLSLATQQAQAEGLKPGTAAYSQRVGVHSRGSRPARTENVSARLSFITTIARGLVATIALG